MIPVLWKSNGLVKICCKYPQQQAAFQESFGKFLTVTVKYLFLFQPLDFIPNAGGFMHVKLILILTLFFGIQLKAAEIIAINKLVAIGVTEGEAVSLTDALRSEIGKTGKYQVMERTQMDDILKEQGFQNSGACDETSCVIEMGKILAVSHMVMGNIGMVGETYSVSVRLVAVGTGKIIASYTENHKGSRDGLLTRIIPILAQKLAGTYQPMKNHTGWWIAGALVVATAIVVPVMMLTRNSNDVALASSDITVRWKQ
jgi:hypothetical protein